LDKSSMSRMVEDNVRERDDADANEGPADGRDARDAAEIEQMQIASNLDEKAPPPATGASASRSGEAASSSTSADAPRAVAPEHRTTSRYLTKYERARLLGTRALQISMGSPTLVELQGETDPLVIATRELKEKKIPIIIRRYLPDNSYEDWSLDQLVVVDQ